MAGIHIGASALRTAQVAIDTIGHNLANASTPGYSRERVNLGAIGGRYGSSRFISGGVRALSIDRVTDELLVGRLVNQEQQVGFRERALGNLLEIESLFSEPGTNGLASRFGSFFGSLSTLQAAPDEPSNRNNLLAEAGLLADRFRELSSDLGRTATASGANLEQSSRNVNDIVRELAQINEQVTQSFGIAHGRHGLHDRQDLLLGELARYGNIHHDRDDLGRLRVKLAGQEIVSSSRGREIEVRFDNNREPELFLKGSQYPLGITSGSLKALIDGSTGGAGTRHQADVNDVAREFIHGFNRVHSTGIPANGGFETLRSSEALLNAEGESISGRPIGELDLPFDISSGHLAVTVIDEDSGSTQQTIVPIDPEETTLFELLGALRDIQGLDASIDSEDHLVLSADPGARFHFGNVLQPDPDSDGNFGGGNAVHASAGVEPFTLQPGWAFDVTVDGGPPQTVTLAASQFANINVATAQEVADAINLVVDDAVAESVDGRLVIRTLATGETRSLSFSNSSGSALGALGLGTATATGTDLPVEINVSGSYTGSHDETFTFRPLQTGTVGLTPGLQVEVLDASGAVVSTLDVGEDYSPGDDLDAGNGITVSFSSGELESGTGRFFEVDAITNSDSSEILVAFGLNSFFEGSGASDIRVNSKLLDDPLDLALGLSGTASDARNIARLFALREEPQEGLKGLSFESSYEGVVNRVGQDTARAFSSLETEELVLESFKNRLEQTRGVSIDEELIALQRHQEAYQAAARFITAVNEVNDLLFQL